jgi:hypothetical protein
MILPEDLTLTLILMPRISFQAFLCDAPVRLAAALLLFSQMGGYLRPECLGGRFSWTKKALFQGSWRQEAAFLARAVLAMRQGIESWEMGAREESACIPLRITGGRSKMKEETEFFGIEYFGATI